MCCTITWEWRGSVNKQPLDWHYSIQFSFFFFSLFHCFILFCLQHSPKLGWKDSHRCCQAKQPTRGAKIAREGCFPVNVDDTGNILSQFAHTTGVPVLLWLSAFEKVTQLNLSNAIFIRMLYSQTKSFPYYEVVLCEPFVICIVPEIMYCLATWQKSVLCSILSLVLNNIQIQICKTFNLLGERIEKVINLLKQFVPSLFITVKSF